MYNFKLIVTSLRYCDCCAYVAVHLFCVCVYTLCVVGFTRKLDRAPSYIRINFTAKVEILQTVGINCYHC